ncbi:MAG: metallophosphoesterase family protein [Eubacteriales bacterium]|nr:metallophosphoesterase family protein [Eubacteriales bacterium]
MKLLVLSDVHGNIDALDAVWAREKDCDAILFAGDMIDYGFFPRECIAWFRERRDILYAVRGNHDEYALARRYEPVDRTRRAKSFFEMDQQLLTEEDLDFLASFPHEATFTVGDTDFYMCHYPDELAPGDVYYAERQLPDNQMRGFACERFAAKFPGAHAAKRCAVFGHSHTQWVASAGPDFSVLNPGSLSYRFHTFAEVRGGDYLVIENGAFRFGHVDFDNARSRALIDRFDFDEATRNYAHEFFHE